MAYVLVRSRPLPLSSLWGGGGTVTFHFPNFLSRLDVEVLLWVCWLDEVVLLVHCCVLQISCVEGTALCPLSCRTLSFSQLQPRMPMILTSCSLPCVVSSVLCLVIRGCHHLGEVPSGGGGGAREPSRAAADWTRGGGWYKGGGGGSLCCFGPDLNPVQC